MGLTEFQKEAIKLMSERNAGSIFVGEWVWPEDIRNNENKAKLVIAKIKKYEAHKSYFEQGGLNKYYQPKGE
jgi:hypothetical protein